MEHKRQFAKNRVDSADRPTEPRERLKNGRAQCIIISDVGDPSGSLQHEVNDALNKIHVDGGNVISIEFSTVVDDDVFMATVLIWYEETT